MGVIMAGTDRWRSVRRWRTNHFAEIVIHQLEQKRENTREWKEKPIISSWDRDHFLKMKDLSLGMPWQKNHYPLREFLTIESRGNFWLFSLHVQWSYSFIFHLDEFDERERLSRTWLVSIFGRGFVMTRSAHRHQGLCKTVGRLIRSEIVGVFEMDDRVRTPTDE